MYKIYLIACLIWTILPSFGNLALLTVSRARPLALCMRKIMYYDECGAAVGRPLIRIQFLFSPLLAPANLSW